MHNDAARNVETYPRPAGNAWRARAALCLALGVCVPSRVTALDHLPDTKPLVTSAELATANVAAIDSFLLGQIEQSRKSRESLWRCDYTAVDAYRRSVAQNRERFRKYIGAIDQRQAVEAIGFVASTATPALVASGARTEIQAVRWPVLDGVYAEGLMLLPKGPVKARVVAIPDADQSPESVSGLSPLVPAERCFALRLAESGCQVVVPVLIDRTDTWSGQPAIRMTNQTHREFIYRQAYFMGRHIIGYEVQKVLAAVDYFAAEDRRTGHSCPIAVVGYGEGGLIAFYSAALDERIAATLVSGYFGPREQVWQEPVYRNVWGLLHEFGDAWIARLVAPRFLLIEACRAPVVPGPCPAVDGRSGAAPGALAPLDLASVRDEFSDARNGYDRLHCAERIRLIESGAGDGPPGSQAALEALLAALDPQWRLAPHVAEPLNDARTGFDGQAAYEATIRSALHA